jgi:ubiquinone/menaquinone biosynthesis C-methylase UbiE
MSINELGLEKQLTEFYRSNKEYFLRMEKSHNANYYRPIFKVLKECNVSFKEKKVLDVGSGTGTFLKILKKFFKNSFEAVGVDTSSIGREFHKNKGIKFYLADAQRLPFGDGSFDFVFSIDALEHIINPQKAISEMYRVAKSGGLILVRTRNYRSPLTNSSFISLAQLIRDLIKEKKDLSQTERLKPIFSSRGGDEDAVSAIFADQLRLSAENLQGELLVFKTWTKGGFWQILNKIPFISLLGSMSLVLFKKA